MSSSPVDSNRTSGSHERWIAEARDMFERVRVRAANAPTIAGPAAAQGDPTAIRREALPGYELIEEISRGGQGVVYRAKQLGTKRDVAIKVILQRGPRQLHAQARFERVVQILGRLKHANIVAIL